MSVTAKSVAPFGQIYRPSLDDLEHMPALMLGFFGAALVTFGAVAIWESARLFGGKVPIGLKSNRVGPRVLAR